MTILKQITDIEHIGGDIYNINNAIKFKDVVITGYPKPNRYHLCATLKTPILYIVNDILEARAAYENLMELNKKVALLPEKYDTLTYKHAVLNITLGERIKALYDIYSGQADIIIATIESCLYYYTRAEKFLEHTLSLSVGGEFDYKHIISMLVKMGYKREDVVEERGNFSIKGDVLDIFMINQTSIIRIISFDDTIESIKSYAADTMETLDEINDILILPTSDLIVDKEEQIKAVHMLQNSVKNKKVNDNIKEIAEELTLRAEGEPIGEHLWYLTPYLNNALSTIGDIIKPNTLVFYDECRLLDDKLKLVINEHNSRVVKLTESGEVTYDHTRTILSKENLYKRLSAFRKIATMPPDAINPIFYEYKLFNLKTGTIPQYFMKRDVLLQDLKSFRISEYIVIICCGDINKARFYAESLSRDDIACSVVKNDEINTPLTSGIFITDLKIKKGFYIHSAKTVVLGCEDVMRISKQSNTTRSKRTPFTIPNTGDYVVHETHGIGLCEGIQRVKSADSERDYIVIGYKNNDKLYVPVENMDSLSRYSGSDNKPSIHKLGGREFEKVKSQVKSKIKKMAIDLLELYAMRSKLKGYKYMPDTEWQEDFNEMFPYTPTPDQDKAIEEVNNDLECGKIMDRLLCGDVGFGKTEVALRAAFKVAIEGKQVAFLAPTTILAMQHFNTLRERFETFTLKTALICRLKNDKEIKQSLKAMEQGDVSIVVGTHRLLSKDVKFKDLGLIILDEEQRFGVEHKERLKSIRNSVNVLSMSATPIPRTLNMAMSGIRDISLLETPPLERLPVQTFVTEYREGLVIDAINREINRGGQVFILYNRVDTIYSYSHRLSELIDNAVIRVAHGQMDRIELENNIADFYKKTANVLVCTTIIENGIDLPDANTLIVLDSDRLGLSELYQLRGRVGRSNRLAYAYFTVRAGKLISEEATKRLNALMEYTEFGSGFKIAMRDLEIRGAGNVLGREQHGNIVKVGYEMYCAMLEESVAELKGKQADSFHAYETEMQIDTSAYVQEDYADLVGGKMRLYRKVSEIKSEEDKQRLIAELKKQTHAIPDTLMSLINISLIKHKAGLIGASKVIINRRLFKLIFKGNKCLSHNELMREISNKKNICVLNIGSDITLDFNIKGGIYDKMNYLNRFLDEVLN